MCGLVTPSSQHADKSCKRLWIHISSTAPKRDPPLEEATPSVSLSPQGPPRHFTRRGELCAVSQESQQAALLCRWMGRMEVLSSDAPASVKGKGHLPGYVF